MGMIFVVNVRILPGNDGPSHARVHGESTTDPGAFSSQSL